MSGSASRSVTDHSAVHPAERHHGSNQVTARSPRLRLPRTSAGAEHPAHECAGDLRPLCPPSNVTVSRTASPAIRAPAIRVCQPGKISPEKGERSSHRYR
jgi:hypothetical protein